MSETKTMSSTKTTSTEQVRFLTVTAIGIALVYVFTWLINIRLPFAPQGGLIHLGNVPLFIFAILFGKKTGAIAGGVGMGLVGCMGFVMGWITEKKQGFQWYVVAMLAACAIKIGGYYIAEGIIYGNWITPVTSIPGNLLQIGTAAVIVLIIIAPLKKVAAKLWN